MKLKEKTYKDQGMTLHYLEGGTGSPLLFFHGVCVEAATYDALLTQLAQKHHVIAPDIPGFGKSSRTPGIWDSRSYAAFFHRFCQSKKIRHISVAGHSLGCALALSLSLNTSIVDKLLLISPAKPQKHMVRMFLSGGIQKTIYELIRYRDLQTTAYIYRYFFKFTGAFIKKPSYYLKTAKMLYQSIEHLQRVPKTLIIWGIDDEWKWSPIPMPSSPTIQTKIVPGNHDVLLFKPDLLMPSINEFLQNI